MNVFALASTSKKRVHASECLENKLTKYAKGCHQCIDCGRDVYVRREKQQAWYFAHFSSCDGQKCPHTDGGETLEHYSAKHFIANNIARCSFQTGECKECRVKQFFSISVEDNTRIAANQCAAEVASLIPGTSEIADILLVHNQSGAPGGAVAAVEVIHTQGVEATKREACTGQGIPVLEVTTWEVERAQRALNDAMHQDTACQLKVRNLRQYVCNHCYLSKAFQSNIHNQLDVWQEYDNAWAAFCNAVVGRPKGRLLNQMCSVPRGAKQPSVHMLQTSPGTAKTITEQQTYAGHAKALESHISHTIGRRTAALEEVRQRAAALAELQKKRTDILQAIRESDASEGKGQWSNAQYWSCFQVATKEVLGK